MHLYLPTFYLISHIVVANILASHIPHLPRHGHTLFSQLYYALRGECRIRTYGTVLPFASLAMRCFRPLSQLSNSTLSHDRVEQCLTKNFYHNICICIIAGAEGFEPPLSEPKADVLTVTLCSNTTLSSTKIRIVFYISKFYSPQLLFPPNI